MFGPAPVALLLTATGPQERALAQPDLTVISLTAPAIGVPGGDITVASAVLNQGSSGAGAFRIVFYYRNLGSYARRSRNFDGSWRTSPGRHRAREGVPVAQAAEEHGIHESTIYGWMTQGATGAPSWSEFARIQKQNKELLELVGELTLRLSVAQKKN